MRHPNRRPSLRLLTVAAAGALLLFATGCAPIHPGHHPRTRSAGYYDGHDAYLHHWHRTSHKHHARHRAVTRHGWKHGGGHNGHHGGCHH